jgi:hypothetical protein
MPLHKEVAAELRKLADALDKTPDAKTVKPYIMFSHRYVGPGAKEMFLSLARVMPRPIKKGGHSPDDYELRYENPAIDVFTVIEKSKTCILVKPAQEAVYECDPILSAMEDESLGAVNA